MTSRVLEEEVTDLETPDVHSVSMKLERAKEVYREYGGIQDKPTKGEVTVWCFYGLCSYFLHTVLIPILFPLIISQIFKAPEPLQGWEKSFEGLSCTKKECKCKYLMSFEQVIL